MILALFGAIIIGITLGLLGAGGSILSVPILIYVLERPEKLAIAESLAIVSCIAIVSSVQYALRTQIHWKSVFFFGLPGMCGAYFGAWYSSYISADLQFHLFALIILAVSGVMWFAPSHYEGNPTFKFSIWTTSTEGLLVGCLTGLLGVGGGFLIVPSLVLFGHLPMIFAVGTSLVIIAMNSLAGFIEQQFMLQALNLSVNWEIIGMISLVGIVGSYVGCSFAKKISQYHLRRAFGVAIFTIGTYILMTHY